MADLKMPEINNIVIAGNLTKDPVYRETSSRTPVVNFHIAANRRYKDSSNRWQEDVCYVGVVAWNKLAESCRHKIGKGSAVMVDGELQSRTFKAHDNKTRTVVEIKAKRIQFLNRNGFNDSSETTEHSSSSNSNVNSLISTEVKLDDDNSFDKFLSEEESDLMNDDNNSEV
jgi:single-strand DNA-binding protein